MPTHMEHGNKHQEQQHIPNPECGHRFTSDSRHKQHDHDNPDPKTNQEVVQEDQNSLPESLLLLILLRCPVGHIRCGSTQSHLQRCDHVSQCGGLPLLLALLCHLSECDPEHEREDGLHQEMQTRQTGIFNESNLTQADALCFHPGWDDAVRQVHSVDELRNQEKLRIDHNQWAPLQHRRPLIGNDPEDIGTDQQDKGQPAVVHDTPDHHGNVHEDVAVLENECCAVLQEGRQGFH